MPAMYEQGQDDINWPPVFVWSGPEGGLMHDRALESVHPRRPSRDAGGDRDAGALRRGRDGDHACGGAIRIKAQPSLFFEGQNLVQGETTRLELGRTVLVQPRLDRSAMMIVATNLVGQTRFEELTHPLSGLVRR